MIPAHAIVPNLPPEVIRQVGRAFVYVPGVNTMGAYVLQVPLQPVRVPPPKAERRAGLHPVIRAMEAQVDDLVGVVVDPPLASPLTRAAVFAQYLVDEWSPDTYEAAVERAGILMDSGVPKAAADRRAVAWTRARWCPPRRCGTCRSFAVMGTSAASARYGACRKHDTAVSPAAEAPECYVRAVTRAQFDAALAYEAMTTAGRFPAAPAA